MSDNKNFTYDNKKFHLRCSGLNKNKFNQLSENLNDQWFCQGCLGKIFPFQNLNDVNLSKELDACCTKSVASWHSIIKSKAGYGKSCSVCKKFIHVAKMSIPCGNCKHLIHKKCANLNNFSINNIRSHLKAWEC